MSSWLGHAETTFTSAPETISIPIKPTKTTQQSTTSLLDLCKSITPPCKLNPLLFNGHLQTGWTVAERQDIPITYQRKIFTSTNTSCPGTFAVDFVVPTLISTSSPTAATPIIPDIPTAALPPRTTLYPASDFDLLGGSDEKPMLIMLHGLSGGSHEIYVRHVLRPLCLDVTDEADRWEACVVNSRGCAHSQITTGFLYHARSTWDVRQTIAWIRGKWPRRKLFGIGFSLGANILTNYLAEDGSSCLLDAAIVVSNPWDLNVCNIAMQNTFMGKHFYSTVMGDSMRALFERHHEQVMKTNPTIDEKKVRSLRYLHEFDRYVQCPTWGWPTEGAYYRDSSCIDAVYGVRIPVLAINAQDDPISVDTAAPYEEVKRNKNIVLCSTSLGGHLGWFEVGGARWFTRPTTAFLQKMANDVDLAALRKLRVSGMENGSASSHNKVPQFDAVRRKLLDSDP